MPVQPLLDLSTLDLSRTVFTREDMQEVLRQRGRFSIVDGVLHLEPEGDEWVVGYIDVRSDAWWAPDHIPGRPILPGMLMVEASAQLGSFDFFKRHPDTDVNFIGFSAIDRTRFRDTVEPDCRLFLVGFAKRVRKRMFSYAFQGVVDDRIVFETEVTGMAL